MARKIRQPLHKDLIAMFIVHVEFSDHVHDFEVKDNGRPRSERAQSLCALVGGVAWEVWS